MIQEGSRSILLLVIASYYDAEAKNTIQKRNEICIMTKYNPVTKVNNAHSCGSHNRVMVMKRD